MKYKEILHKIIIGIPYVKKNSQKIIQHKYTHRIMAIYTANFVGWEKDTLMQLGMERGRLHKIFKKPIDFPIILKCHFYRPDNRRVDISALYEGIQDALVKAEIIKDDNYKIVKGHDGSRVFIDRENPRIEFWILEEVSEG